MGDVDLREQMEQIILKAVGAHAAGRVPDEVDAQAVGHPDRAAQVQAALVAGIRIAAELL